MAGGSRVGYRKPALADLGCKAGGCTRGYQLAGFRVVGVDLEPQPHYCGDDFVQADALTFPLSGFDAVHASPPCQGYSKLAAMHPGTNYPMLIPVFRERLLASGLPYVIENVPGAPLKNPVLLCGSMFGLAVARGYLRRHRLFETSFPVYQLECRHVGRAAGVYGHGGYSGKHRMLYRDEAALAMGIDWMNRDELTQAIPPAYTQYIGWHLLEEVLRRRRGGGKE